MTSFPPSFNILIQLKNCDLFLFRLHTGITMLWATNWSLGHGIQCFTINSTLSLSHWLPSLHLNLQSDVGDQQVYLLEPASLKTQAGIGEAAVECDGYNNPCGGSAHVLNCCHKCSSTRLRRDHQSHSAILSPDALFLSRYMIAPCPSAPNKSSSTYKWDEVDGRTVWSGGKL